MIQRKDITLAIASGILLVLGFPPFDLYPLAWVSIVPLMIALWEKKFKASFILGTITGFVYFIGTIYWVFNSMYYYGYVPAVLSLLLLIALCLYLGAYVGIFSVFFNYLSRRSRIPNVFIVPILWVTLEFVRTYALTGFPWSAIGYSQYKFLTLIQAADITGVYGISFLVTSFNGLIFDVAVCWPKRSSRMPLFARWPITISIALYAVIITSALAYGTWRLKTAESGREIKATVVQGNIEQGKKWDSRFKQEVIDTYMQLSINASTDKPDIIVWPESALPFIYGYEKELTEEFHAFQRELGSYLLFGSMTVKNIDKGKPLLANSAVMVSPEGNVLPVYDKIHLVPYGEYVPLKSIFPFIKKLTVGIGDFVHGEGPVIMETPFARIGNLICYEIIFPGLVRKFADKDADILVTITNDAWFGRTSAPYQHFSMAVFRAVENRVPVIRAANTGVSGFIDPMGKIRSKSDIFVKTVMKDEVKVGAFGKSFYTRYGDLFTFLCIISSVLLIANTLHPEKR
jgi:apolipoprotein N-acyltransferase